jgi:two-component system, LytTR family, sensor kinase
VLKAEALAREAELKMLRYQLNPHFLFNSLNSAGALIAENPQQAEKMINELSDFLRYSLVDSKGGAVPLKEEIEAVKNYLNIEKVRFEEKLEVKFSIAKPAEEFVVPNFLLHPLVENAVKYGMQTSQLPLQIEVQAERTNRKLLLAVVNSGTWQKESETSVNNNGMRVGLENVRQRLAQFFPSRHSMRTFERDGRVWVQLEMTE